MTFQNFLVEFFAYDDENCAEIFNYIYFNALPNSNNEHGMYLKADFLKIKYNP